MSVYEINPLQDARWDEFIRLHPASSVFQTGKWLRALEKSYGYEPVALTTSAPDQPLRNALVMCRVKSSLTGSRLVSLPFSDHSQPLVESDNELSELVGYLRNTVKSNGWKYAELRPVTNLDPQVAAALGLVESTTFALHVLDLSPAEDKLFKSFHKSCVQRKVTKAEKDGLTGEEGRSERLLEMFYRLLLLTRRRHQLPPQPMEWFRNLIESFGNDLSIRVAFKDGQPVASMLTLFDGKTLTYKYGCSDAKFHNLGGMPFLFWETMRDAKLKGAKYFDFGRSETDNPGLIAFKGHWNGVQSEMKYYRFSQQPAQNGGGKAWRMEAAGKVFSMLPDFCLTAAGKLLYRHIG